MLAAVLADDLTGALEVGALAAAAGRSVRVHLGFDGAPADADVVVVDTQTRHAGHGAPDRFAAALDGVRVAAPWIYKKVDSTLRGPIAAELVALAQVQPGVPLVYVPAYPSLGRTVTAGELHVDGVPLTESAFADDPRHAASTSSVVGLFEGLASATVVGSATDLERALSSVSVSPAGAAGPLSSVLVCDALADDDLDRIAAVLRAAPVRPLVAGAGGFAARWVGDVPGKSGRRPKLPRARNPLVVSGSRHPASERQVDTARRSGIPCVTPAEVIGRRPEDVARALAASALRRIDTTAPDVLVLFGGDTATAVLGALGCTVLTPLGEVRPGVPVSTWERMTIVTKAGGFGDDDVVASIMEALG